MSSFGLRVSAPIRHRHRRQVFTHGLGLALLLVAIPLAFASDLDDLQTRRRVLMLSSESRAFPAVTKVGDAIRSTFASAGLFPEFFTEYLDLSWTVDPQYEQRLRALLRAKHTGRKFDVVIVGGLDGLRFALANRMELFPGAPIVFCAVPPGIVGEGDLPPDVTGTWMAFDGAATLDAAVRLQPNARRVVVIGGAAPADRLYVDVVKRQLAERWRGLDVSYLEGLPLEEVRARLSQLSRDAIVLYVTIQRDGAGRTFSAAEALHLIAPASGAPVYALSDTFAGLGMVGGRVFSFEAQGTRVAEIAVRLLRGDPAWRVTPTVTPNRYLFDWRELHRWGLREADVPDGGMVVNQPPSFWTRYRWPIVGAMVVISLEAALIVGLLWQTRGRRRVEATLQDRLEFETLVSSLSAMFAKLHGAEIDRGIEQSLQRVGEQLGVDRATILRAAPGSDVIAPVHIWQRPDVPRTPPTTRRPQVPWALKRIASGQPVRFSRLDELPADAATDRETFARLGITSNVTLPLIVGGTTTGGLSLSHLGRERAWPDDLMQRLDFVAGIFASALLRRHNVMELEKLRNDLSHFGRVAAMSELAASLAHELNQPLAAILNNAQAAARLIDGGAAGLKDLRAILSDIMADDKRASEVIRNLRAFIRKDERHRSAVDINAVVRDVVNLVRSAAIIRNVSVDVDLEPGLPPVFGDRVQLQQVLVNLLMNALDAVGSAIERRVLVTTRKAGPAIHLSVKDSGGGIPADDLARIFDRFYTTKATGLGMGLSIARSLIEAHDGRLWAENNEDGGATFTLRVPVMEDHRG